MNQSEFIFLSWILLFILTGTIYYFRSKRQKRIDAVFAAYKKRIQSEDTLQKQMRRLNSAIESRDYLNKHFENMSKSIRNAVKELSKIGLTASRAGEIFRNNLKEFTK
jgi:biopolymer transport protein ExbB/TolQ